MVAAKWLGTLQAKRPLSVTTLTRTATWLLVVLLAWILGRLVWSIAQPATAPSPWQVKTVSVSSANRTGFQVSDVLGMNLFGRYQQNAPIVKKKNR